MDKSRSITRRDFLYLAGAGSAVALGTTHPWLRAFAAPSPAFVPDLGLELTAMRHMSWRLNGRTFSMNEVAADEIVKLNTTELWEFSNDSGMGMMGMRGMPHPIHIHGLQFQVVQRTITSRNKAAWQSLNAGLVDEGWKDTVLVMPGERVKLLLRFEDYTGLYLYHCHNLEHEDLGMMRNYRIQA